MPPLVISLISLLFASAVCQIIDLYLGCYKDVAHESETEKRDLPETVISYSEVLVIDPCIRECRKRGYRYAGAKIILCVCGNSYGKWGRIDDRECIPQICGISRCGGEFSLAIFRVCPSGQFGEDCGQICHCANIAEACEPLNGYCPAGGCLYGWITQSCSIRDKCIDQFGCQNGGTCKPDRFKINYMCECYSQFRGAHCEIGCPIGYYGDDCERICKCESGACNIVTGVCSSGCMPGFFGVRCDNYNPCSTSPCKNGGSCYDIEGQYHCRCTTDFLGYNCQYDKRASGTANEFAILPPALRFRQMEEFSEEFQMKRMAKGNVRSYQYEYIGCFRDLDLDRDLDGDLWIDDDMGPQVCSRHCRRKEFTFAAIQAGTDCRCGNRFGKHGIVPIAECDFVCANEPLQKCGAEDLNSIYSVCPAGRYEPSCKPACNCLADMHCDLMTGICPNKLCKQGWTGLTCNEGMDYDELQVLTSRLLTSLGTYGILVTALTIWVGCQSKKRKRVEAESIEMEEEFAEMTV